jgi:hypothetical protein
MVVFSYQSMSQFIQSSPEMQGLVRDVATKLQAVEFDLEEKALKSHSNALLPSIEQVSTEFSHAIAETPPGGDSGRPKLGGYKKLLKEGYPGIRKNELPNGDIEWVVGYSYEVNNALAKFVDLSRKLEGSGKYPVVKPYSRKPITAEQKVILENSMNHIASEVLIRFEEVENVEDAYFTIANYEFAKSATLGKSNFPNSNGSYVILSSDHDLSQSTALHELMHLLGAHHSFQSEEIAKEGKHHDSPNATLMDYNHIYGVNDGALTLTKAEIGGRNFSYKRKSEPETLQLLDYDFLGNYGFRSERDTKHFVIDGEESFYGTYPVREGDALTIQNAHGVIDLTARLSHPSVTSDRPVNQAELNKTTTDEIPRSTTFLTHQPQSVFVEGGMPVIVMGEKKSELILENSAVTLFANGTDQLVDMDDSQEKIIMQPDDTRILLKDFDLYNDLIYSSEAIADVTIEPYRDHSKVTFLPESSGTAQPSVAVLLDIDARALTLQKDRVFQTITDEQRTALINGIRPAINLEPGNNGYIGEINNNAFHYNHVSAEEQELVVKVYQDMERNHSKIQIVDKNSQELVSKFSRAGIHHNRLYPIYHRGEALDITELRVKMPNTEHLFTVKNGYRDKAYANLLTAKEDIKEDAFGFDAVSTSAHYSVINPQKHNIVEFYGRPNDPCYVLRQSISDQGKLTLLSYDQEPYFLSTRNFNLDTDEIRDDTMQTVYSVAMPNGEHAFIMSDPRSRNVEEARIMHTQALVGESPLDAKRVSVNDDGTSFQIEEAIEVIEYPFKRLSAALREQLNTMSAQAAKHHDKLTEVFPDITPQPTPQLEAQQNITPVKSQSTGRGF